MKVTFEDALNDCLDRMAEGEDIHRCAAAYPEYAEELVCLLEAARSTMQSNSSLTYSPAAKARGLARLKVALSDERPRSRWRLRNLDGIGPIRHLRFGSLYHCSCSYDSAK